MAIEWLEELETRVHEAAERLRESREENRELNERIEELETKLAAVSSPPADDTELAREREERLALEERVADLERQLEVAEANFASQSTASEEWLRERDEIRARVESLTRHLEGLV